MELEKIHPDRPCLPTRTCASKRYLGFLFFESFVLILASAAEDPAEQKIPPLRPVKPIIPPGFWEQYSGWIIAGSALLVALITILIWWLTRPKPPVLVPPGVQAKEALEKLRQAPETGATLSKVSQIVRGYFAAVFGLPPGEYTTTEFSTAISGRREVGADLKDEVNQFLRSCDERKFSPSPPSTPVGAVERAERLVQKAEAKRVELEKLAQPGAGSPPTAAIPPVVSSSKAAQS